jgi:hypothetical protein
MSNCFYPFNLQSLEVMGRQVGHSCIVSPERYTNSQLSKRQRWGKPATIAGIGRKEHEHIHQEEKAV